MLTILGLMLFPFALLAVVLAMSMLEERLRPEGSTTPLLTQSSLRVVDVAATIGTDQSARPQAG